MKKLLALILTVSMLITMSLPFISNAAEINSLTVLDFGSANNGWLFDANTDGYGIQDEFLCLDHSLSDDGEIMTVTVKDLPANGLDARFVVDIIHDWDRMPFKAGKETAESTAAEYMKIRIKNNSACETFGMQWVGSSGRLDLDARVITWFDIDSYTDGFVEYVFSVSEWNAKTNFNNLLPVDENTGETISKWSGTIGKLAISPFGLYLTDGSGPYNGASMEIDYIVFGSKDFCENYKSNLQKEEDQVVSIAITHEPNEVTFVQGDTLNTAGMVLEATLEDGTKRTIESGWKVDVDAETEGNQNKLKEAGTITVKILYGSAVAEYDVYVRAVIPNTTNIKITGNFKKMTYLVDEKLDETGFAIEITCSDGTKVQRTSGWTLRYDFSQPGETAVEFLWNDVRVVYIGGFYVTVPDYIIVSAAPTKVTYKQGDMINLSGLEVTLYYKVGQNREQVTSTIPYSVQNAYRFTVPNPRLDEAGEEVEVIFYLDRDDETEFEGFIGVITVSVEEVEGYTTPSETTSATTVIDDGTTDAPATTAAPETSATTAGVETTAEAPASTPVESSTTTENSKGGNTTLIIIIVAAVVVVGGGVACFFIFKKK